jgi:putative oxidoreductase
MSKLLFLSKHKDQIYALMRIVIGILFISHGIQKITAFANGAMSVSNIWMTLAAIIETLGGLMIILGLQAKWAALIASGEMAVAYFKAHAFRDFWPIDNGGEKAVFYCFAFLFIAAYGSGIWSLDNKK